MRHIGPPYGRVICSIHVTCSYWHTNRRVAAWTLLPNTCSCVVRSCTRSEVCARKLRDLVRVTIAYAVCVFLHVSAEFCAGCIEGRQCEVNDVFPVVDGATKRRWLSQKKRHLAYVTWGVQHGVPADFPPVPLPVCAERAIKSKWPIDDRAGATRSTSRGCCSSDAAHTPAFLKTPLRRTCRQQRRAPTTEGNF